MDVFAFASRSETQGMVVAEAMAAGVPVVALNASGVREVVRDGENGFLLPAGAPVEAFARAVARCAKNDVRKKLGEGARGTADQFSREQSAMSSPKTRRRGSRFISVCRQRLIKSTIVPGFPLSCTFSSVSNSFEVGSTSGE